MSTNFPPRRGLAMLELTLALPILLFIMALIINYGTIAAWKVREHSVARLAVWETRWPRSGSTDPRPSYWPATATMESSDQGTVAGMDDSRVDLPVARGPLPGATVNSDLLDPTRGLREGSASLTRKYPLLGKMGSYTHHGPNVADRRQMAISADGDGRQLAAANSRVVHAGRGPGVAGECLRAVGAGDRSGAVPQPTGARWTTIPISSTTARSSAGAALPISSRGSRSMCTTDRAVDRPGRPAISSIAFKATTRQAAIPSVAEDMASAFLGLYQRALAAFQAILKRRIRRRRRRWSRWPSRRSRNCRPKSSSSRNSSKRFRQAVATETRSPSLSQGADRYS